MVQNSSQVQIRILSNLLHRQGRWGLEMLRDLLKAAQQADSRGGTEIWVFRLHILPDSEPRALLSCQPP